MRYIILVMLNLPIILLALVNIVTQYKLRRVSKNRFYHQLFIWVAILVVLVSAFPMYNLAIGRPALDAHELSLFDIIQTTGMILLFYIANNQRQRLDQQERRVRDLHQELSIKLAEHDEKKR